MFKKITKVLNKFNEMPAEFSDIKTSRHSPSFFWVDAEIILKTIFFPLVVSGIFLYLLISFATHQIAAEDKAGQPPPLAFSHEIFNSVKTTDAERDKRFQVAELRQTEFLEKLRMEVTLLAFDPQPQPFRKVLLVLLGAVFILVATLGLRTIVGVTGIFFIIIAFLSGPI